MTKKQFEELLKALRGIETALLALRVPNTVYIPSPYVTPNPPQPFVPSPYPYGGTICTIGSSSTAQFEENPHS